MVDLLLQKGQNGPPFIDYCTGGLLINYLMRKAEKEPIKSLDWGIVRATLMMKPQPENRQGDKS